MALSLFSCSKPEETGDVFELLLETFEVSDLVGKWEYEDGTIVEFTVDKMIMEFYGMTMEMDYEVDGKELTIEFEGEKETGKFKVKDDKLYLYEDDIDDAEVLEKVD